MAHLAKTIVPTCSENTTMTAFARPFKSALCVTLLSVVAACSIPTTPTLRLAKPGATDREHLQDRKDCIDEAKTVVNGPIPGALSRGDTNYALSQSAFTKCMRERGYTVDPQGPFDGRPGLGMMPIVR